MGGGESESQAVDGRVQRSVRSRTRIAEALQGLVQEGVLQPTGEQVAERARVGLRTVFRHFEDMDSLFAEVHSRVERMVQTLDEEPVVDGDLESRVRSLVRRRARIFELMTPFERSGRLQRWRSAFLQQMHARMVSQLRRDLAASLPELDASSAPTRAALELVTSFEAWDRLRADQGIGRERAEQVVRGTVLALVEVRGAASD